MLYLVFQFFKDFLMWKGALIKQKAKTLWGLSCCVPSVLTGLLGYHKQASWPTALEHTTHQRCSGVLAVHVQGINKSQNLFSNPYFRSSFEKNIYIFFFFSEGGTWVSPSLQLTITDPHIAQQLPVQLRNTLITHPHIIYPVPLLVHVSENVLSQTIKPIKMEVN